MCSNTKGSQFRSEKRHFRLKNFPRFRLGCTPPQGFAFSPLTTQQITQSGRLFKTDHKSNKRETRENMDTWEVEEAVAPAAEEQQVEVFIFTFFRLSERNN